MKIKLPEALQAIYEFGVTPKQDECYFNFLGQIKFSELTEVQAERLIQAKSPHIKRKKAEPKK